MKFFLQLQFQNFLQMLKNLNILHNNKSSSIIHQIILLHHLPFVFIPFLLIVIIIFFQ
ncbi:unnamed protein product [Meloidogyne enterolobii]|uniref:Uncharacterized protein n=1 Tax=Meloidogyne enterolobii TaxID=390850 RepID=A0ACB1A5T5_MELEN